MARLWARTTTYESVGIGDELPILVKWETAETIRHFAILVSPEPSAGHDALPDAADDSDASRDGRDLPPQALVSYVTELLEKGFPLPSLLAEGSSLDLQLLAPVQAEDTLSLSGWVVGKEERGGHRLVECRVNIENQEGVRVAEASVAVSL